MVMQTSLLLADTTRPSELVPNAWAVLGQATYAWKGYCRGRFKWAAIPGASDWEISSKNGLKVALRPLKSAP